LTFKNKSNKYFERIKDISISALIAVSIV